MEGQIQSFLNSLQTKRDFSLNTLEAYRNDLGQFAAFVGKEGAQHKVARAWEGVDRDLFLQYLASLQERTYAPATVARKLAAARSFLSFLVAQKVLATNPAQGIAGPRVGKEPPRVISVEKVEQLLGQPDKHITPEAVRDKAMLELLYATGVRVTELMSLNVGDVSFRPGRVRCPGKGSRQRIIPIPGRVAQALQRYLAESRCQLTTSTDERALFLNRRGERLTRQGFWLILKGYAREAKIGAEITSHVLRHSIATHLLHSGRMNLKELQEFLGHANISTTQVYIQGSARGRRLGGSTPSAG